MRTVPDHLFQTQKVQTAYNLAPFIHLTGESHVHFHVRRICSRDQPDA